MEDNIIVFITGDPVPMGEFAVPAQIIEPYLPMITDASTQTDIVTESETEEMSESEQFEATESRPQSTVPVDTMEVSTQTDYVPESPACSEAVESTDDNEFAESLEQSVIAVSSEQNEIAESLIQNVYAQSLDQNLCTELSQQTVYAQPLDPNVYAQSVDQNVYTESSEQNVYAQPLDSNVYVQSLDQNLYAASSDQNVYTQPLDQNVYVQSSDQNVYVQPLDQNVYLQPLDQNVYTESLVQNKYVESTEQKEFTEQHEIVEEYIVQPIAQNHDAELLKQYEIAEATDQEEIAESIGVSEMDESIGLGEMDESIGIGDMDESTGIGDMDESTGLEEMAELTGLNEIAGSTGKDEITESTKQEETAISKVDEVAESTEQKEIVISTVDGGVKLTKHDKAAKSTDQKKKVNKVKSKSSVNKVAKSKKREVKAISVVNEAAELTEQDEKADSTEQDDTESTDQDDDGDEEWRIEDQTTDSSEEDEIAESTEQEEIEKPTKPKKIAKSKKPVRKAEFWDPDEITPLTKLLAKPVCVDSSEIDESTTSCDSFVLTELQAKQASKSIERAETVTDTEAAEIITDTEAPTDTDVPTTELDELTETDEAIEPASKKAKVAETIDSLIENMVNSYKPLQAIMSDDYIKPIPFTKFYVGQVNNMRELSKIILTLNQKIPLKDFMHLKRAFRKEVLLFPTSYLNAHTHASIKNYIEENVKELQDSFEYFKMIDVPAVAPKLRKQYVECGRSWSCNFHPDKYLEKLYNSELFTLEELHDHRLFMGMAFEVARYYMSQKKPDLEPSDILEADLNATVVVDPSEKSVVAVAFDNRANHPIQHSTMIAIDNVAKTQNGGVWSSSTDVYSENLRGIGIMELLLHLKKKYPCVKFGAKDYISKSDLEEMNLSASECPYLCTEYYVYVLREPCVMCCMALVHARANRVFFYKKHAMGALCSKTKLHCVNSLNHRYEVFTDFA